MRTAVSKLRSIVGKTRIDRVRIQKVIQNCKITAIVNFKKVDEKRLEIQYIDRANEDKVEGIQ